MDFLPQLRCHGRASRRASGRTTVSFFEEHVCNGLDAAIELPTIGTSLKLAELYERTDFSAAAEDECAKRWELDYDE